jgi:TonB family protein
VSLEYFIDKNGNTTYLKPIRATKSGNLLKHLIQEFDKTTFNHGAKKGKKPTGIKGTYTFVAYTKSTDEKRLEIGQQFFSQKDYLTAAFHWNAMNTDSLKLDSTQYYNLAVANFLSDYSPYSWRTKKYYELAAQNLDWSKYSIREIKKTDDPDNPVEFVIAEDQPEATAEADKDELMNISSVEQRPLAEGCENEKTDEAQFRCFNMAIMQSIAKNFSYPVAAVENGWTDKIYVSFVIEKDGSIDNLKIERGKYDALNIEGLRVVTKLPKMTPATLHQEPVRMTYTVPINFRLQ